MHYIRLAALLILSASIAFAKEPPPNKALHALFEREFHSGLEESPESATYLGIPGYDDRLSDHSAEAVARRNARVKKVIAELKHFPDKALNEQDRISRDMMLWDLGLAEELQSFYADLPFGPYDGWTRATSMNGPQLNYGYLVQATRFASAADYENYLKRLDAIPRVMDQDIEAMRAGMKSGWMPPRAAMERVPPMFASFAATDVTSTPLWRPFADFPPAIPEADRKRIAERGRAALSEKVHPAFARMKRFLEEEYLPACRAQLGASSLPGGPRYYDHLIKQRTTTNLSAEEIHQIGLKEVARIHSEMDRVIATTGFKGTFPEFIKFINTDPQFLFKTAADRLRAYRDMAKRADAELPKLFAELPRTPYGVRPMEEYEGDNSDHYSAPALDGSRAGFFDANVNKLENRPSYEMESTLLHEAVPGHHLQTARAIELKSLPRFRRSSWYVAYGEGWALYAESLGFDMGFYTDPYMHFGRLAGEMLRACRLVIDTGLHAKGWGREQSIRYLVDNAGVVEAYAEAEIDRYIVWPGQALGYKIGELKIRALRDKARTALDERFDIRRFHNAVLDDGPLPLNVLEARIDAWIAAEKRRR